MFFTSISLMVVISLFFSALPVRHLRYHDGVWTSDFIRMRNQKIWGMGKENKKAEKPKEEGFKRRLERAKSSMSSYDDKKKDPDEILEKFRDELKSATLHLDAGSILREEGLIFVYPRDH